MIGESCKNVAATGECTHYYNAFRTLISVAMPHARGDCAWRGEILTFPDTLSLLRGYPYGVST